MSIVSHGHGPLLCRFLTQLNCEPALADVHVVVTLNCREEAFDPAPFPAIRLTIVRNTTPRGFGANHNAAYRHCSTRFFAILNPDLELSGSEPFSRLVQRLKREDGCAMVAPTVRRADGGREDSVRTNLTPLSLLIRHVLGRRIALASASQTGRDKKFFWVAGMCLVVDASAYGQLGGFDERFFLYCEDYDLCARLHLSGRSIAIEPSAEIVHDARRGSHGSTRHLRWHLESLFKVWTSAAFWKVTLGG